MSGAPDLEADPALIRERQALVGDGRPRNVAGEILESGEHLLGEACFQIADLLDRGIGQGEEAKPAVVVGLVAPGEDEDPEAARQLLAPLVEEDLSRGSLDFALATSFAEQEKPMLFLRTACAAILARAGEEKARSFLQAIPTWDFYWLGYRAIHWSRSWLGPDQACSAIEASMELGNSHDELRKFQPDVPAKSTFAAYRGFQLASFERGRDRAVQILRDALADLEGDSRREALRILARIGGPEDRHAAIDTGDPLLRTYGELLESQ